jgi:hypothetical protein
VKPYVKVLDCLIHPSPLSLTSIRFLAAPHLTASQAQALHERQQRLQFVGRHMMHGCGILQRHIPARVSVTIILFSIRDHHWCPRMSIFLLMKMLLGCDFSVHFWSYIALCAGSKEAVASHLFVDGSSDVKSGWASSTLLTPPIPYCSSIFLYLCESAIVCCDTKLTQYNIYASQ